MIVRLILTFALIGCLTGCTSVLYQPNVPPVPLLSQQGEVQAAVGYNAVSVAPRSQGYELQFAASPIEHLGIMVNGSLSRRSTTGEELHHFLDGGLGYYWKGESGRYEALLGYGSGSSRDSGTTFNLFGPSSHYEISGSYRRAFLQFNSGLNPWHIAPDLSLELVAGTRLAYVWFTDVTENGVAGDARSGAVFETVVMPRIGLFDVVYAESHLGVSTPLFGAHREESSFTPMLFGGFGVRLVLRPDLW